MRSPAIANDFDMTPIDTPRVQRIGAGRQPVRGIELQEAIDLVDDEVRARLARRSRRAPSNVARSGCMPVGLCGALTTMSRVAGVTCRRRRVHVDRPAVGLAQLVERDVRSGRARDLVQALVAGPGDDGVVARPEQDVGQAEDAPPPRRRRRGPRRASIVS